MLGCTQTDIYKINESKNNTTLSNGSISNNTSVVKVNKTGAGAIEAYTIAASYNGNIWKFNLSDYGFADNSNPFSDSSGGDLGKTSTAYIRINESNLNFLAPYDHCGIGEYQSILVTPKVSKGKGVLFEAVYVADLKGQTTCRTENQKLVLLGEEYEITELTAPSGNKSRIIRGGSIKVKERSSNTTFTLSDAKGFNGDDRWPVVLGWRNGELEKIIVYMGGYFYDIEGSDGMLSLFGAGNRVLAGFSDLDKTPKFIIMTTDRTGRSST